MNNIDKQRFLDGLHLDVIQMKYLEYIFKDKFTPIIFKNEIKELNNIIREIDIDYNKIIFQLKKENENLKRELNLHKQLTNHYINK